MAAKTHKRFFTGNAEIVRSESGEETREIRGEAIVFNSWSENLGGFIERILPNALDDVDLSGVVATRNHNFDKPLARADKGTLILEKTETGLRYHIPNMPNTTAGNDTLEDVRCRNIDGASFMFTVEENDMDWEFKNTRTQGIAEVTIKKIKRIYELGPVTMPAYSGTSARSMTEIFERKKKEVESKELMRSVTDTERKYKQLRAKI